MLSFLWDLASFIVALGVLITVHEFGHFWVARRCGVRVERFSIGFGKALWILAFVIGFCFLNAILLWQPLHSLFSVTTITMTQLFTIYGLALIPTALIQLGRMLRHR